MERHHPQLHADRLLSTSVRLGRRDVRACVRACVLAQVCKCVCVQLIIPHACMHACMHNQQPPTVHDLTESVLNYPTKRELGHKLNRRGHKDSAYFVLRDGCLFFFDKHAVSALTDYPRVHISSSAMDG